MKHLLCIGLVCCLLIACNRSGESVSASKTHNTSNISTLLEQDKNYKLEDIRFRNPENNAAVLSSTMVAESSMFYRFGKNDSLEILYKDTVVKRTSYHIQDTLLSIDQETFILKKYPDHLRMISKSGDTFILR